MSYRRTLFITVFLLSIRSAGQSVPEAVSGFRLPVSDIGGGFTFAEDSRDSGSAVYQCWAYHPGWDMNPAHGDADLGTPVFAAADGVVRVANKNAGQIWGRLVIQHHYEGQTFYTQYGHVSGSSILVSVGENVQQGQKIAEVGKEGTTSAHLHFEVRTAAHPAPLDASFWQSCSNQIRPFYLAFQDLSNINSWYLDPHLFVPSHGPYPLPVAHFTMTGLSSKGSDLRPLLVSVPPGMTIPIVFDASSSFDENIGAQLANWNWTIDGFAVSTQATFTANLAVGTHSVALAVLDSFGLQSSPAQGLVTVRANSMQSQFTESGQMSTPRLGHTANIISADGKVLVAGGNNGNGSTLGTAEIYDPATGTFQNPTQPLTLVIARSNHTATRLDDGKVLMAGGVQGVLALNSAELFDPITATFIGTGSMQYARFAHTATLLKDDTVLITGGYDDSGTTFSSAEIYSEPSPRNSGGFVPTKGSMSNARVGHAASLLLDGRVLITGGAEAFGSNSFLSSAEMYDPATGQFTAVTPMNVPHWSHTSITLPDGRVVIAGGYDPSVEVFSPSTQSFSVVGHLSKPRIQAAAVLLSNGDVLITGGGPDACCAGVNPFDTTDVIHPLADGTFSISSGAQMVSARMKHTATVLPTGAVLLTGGETTLDINFQPKFLNTSELYIPVQ